jgi:hypothetical protein
MVITKELLSLYKIFAYDFLKIWILIELAEVFLGDKMRVIKVLPFLLVFYVSAVGQILEKILSKPVVALLLFALLLIGLLGWRFSKARLALGMLFMLFPYFHELVYGIVSVNALIWNSIFSFFLILVLSSLPREAMRIGALNNYKNLLMGVKVIALLSLIIAITFALYDIGFNDKSKPFAFTFGALFFGIYIFFSATLPIKSNKDLFVTSAIITLSIFFVQFHKSKTLLFMSLVYLGFLALKYASFSKRMTRFGLYAALLMVTILFFYYKMDYFLSVITSLEGSERIARTILFYDQISWFGGNLISSSGPLGVVESGESYLLFLYGSYGLAFSVYFYFLVYLRVDKVLFLAFLLSSLVTEPYIGYAASALLLSYLMLVNDNA